MNFSRILGFLAFGLATSASAADDHPAGYAFPWQMNLQPPVTPVMEKLYNLHSWLLILITVITIFVLCLLTYTCVRFRAKTTL